MPSIHPLVAEGWGGIRSSKGPKLPKGLHHFLLWNTTNLKNAPCHACRYLGNIYSDKSASCILHSSAIHISCTFSIFPVLTTQNVKFILNGNPCTSRTLPIWNAILCPKFQMRNQESESKFLAEFPCMFWHSCSNFQTGTSRFCLDQHWWLNGSFGTSQQK